jgi:Flp pilus assembly protein TadG
VVGALKRRLVVLKVMNLRQSETGAVIVESALTIMVLFMLLLGILELGRAFKTYHVLTNAAREGARFSVAPDPGAGYNVPTASAIKSFVSNYLAAGSVKGTTVAVDCVYAVTPAPNLTACPTGANSAQDTTLPIGPNQNPIYTRVQVAVPSYKFLFFPFTVNMQTKAVMRNENSED